MHGYEIFHVVMSSITLSFLSMDDVLDFCQDMPTAEFIICSSKVSREEWIKFKAFSEQ